MRYADPRGLVVQVWQGDKTLCDQPCVDAGDAATEAHRLFTDCCPPDPSADEYNRDCRDSGIREPGGLMSDPLTLVDQTREQFAAAFNRQDISALRALCEDDLITREVIEKRHPQIVVYHLTQKGRSLRLLIDQMIVWGLMNLECC